MICTVPNLSQFAFACRAALESIAEADRELEFETFPHGACGATTDLIGVLLSGMSASPLVIASGRYHPALDPMQSHAWLEVDGVIVDLTHDQFEGTGLTGWVFTQSAWHDLFEIDRLPLTDLSPSYSFPRETCKLVRAYLSQNM